MFTVSGGVDTVGGMSDHRVQLESLAPELAEAILAWSANYKAGMSAGECDMHCYYLIERAAVKLRAIGAAGLGLDG